MGSEGVGTHEWNRVTLSETVTSLCRSIRRKMSLKKIGTEIIQHTCCISLVRFTFNFVVIEN